jgi:hypothetical protein
MRLQGRYLMRDQVRNQIRSIMGEETSRFERRRLGSHLLASGVLTFCCVLLVILAH